jgi:Transposase domain (DUF772)
VIIRYVALRRGWNWILCGQEVVQFYGIKGNISEDPVVIMKMMLLLFLDNVRSERELIRIIPERLDYMWFLGYGLDDINSESQRLEQSPQALGQGGFRCTHPRTVSLILSQIPLRRHGQK